MFFVQRCPSVRTTTIYLSVTYRWVRNGYDFRQLRNIPKQEIIPNIEVFLKVVQNQGDLTNSRFLCRRCRKGSRVEFCVRIIRSKRGGYTVRDLLLLPVRRAVTLFVEIIGNKNLQNFLKRFIFA